jgi:hypothetical protein
MEYEEKERERRKRRESGEERTMVPCYKVSQRTKA